MNFSACFSPASCRREPTSALTVLAVDDGEGGYSY